MFWSITRIQESFSSVSLSKIGKVSGTVMGISLTSLSRTSESTSLTPVAVSPCFSLLPACVVQRLRPWLFAVHLLLWLVSLKTIKDVLPISCQHWQSQKVNFVSKTPPFNQYGFVFCVAPNRFAHFAWPPPPNFAPARKCRVAKVPFWFFVAAVNAFRSYQRFPLMFA